MSRRKRWQYQDCERGWTDVQASARCYWSFEHGQSRDGARSFEFARGPALDYLQSLAPTNPSPDDRPLAILRTVEKQFVSPSQCDLPTS